MGRLRGKVAIIKGSTSGMGEDTARVFIEEGAQLVVTGRNEERANSSPSVYSGLKAGVCHLSRCFAMELSEFGIRVNTISPGAIVTPIFAKQFGVPPGKEQQVTEVLSQVLDKAVPVGRSGRGKDIALAAVYLASDESSYVTGQDLVVDGGLTGGLPQNQKRAQWQILQQAIAPLITA